MDCLWMVVVASRKRVSCGAIFRKTTLEMEDFPLLRESIDDKVTTKSPLDYLFKPISSIFGLYLPKPIGGYWISPLAYPGAGSFDGVAAAES